MGALVIGVTPTAVKQYVDLPYGGGGWGEVGRYNKLSLQYTDKCCSVILDGFLLCTETWCLITKLTMCVTFINKMQTYTRHLTTWQFSLFNENTLPTNFYLNHGPKNLNLKKEGAGIFLSPVAKLFLIFNGFLYIILP